MVHITSGVSALVCALYLGKRVGYPERAHAAAQRGSQFHRSVPAVGGMVRFQCRQRPRRGRPRHKRIRRHAFRGSRRGVGWAGAEWIRNGKPSVLGGISGAVAGLVAITPASGFVKPMPALVIGFIAGVVLLLDGGQGEANLATTILWTPSASTEPAVPWAPSSPECSRPAWLIPFSKTRREMCCPLG